MVELQVIGGAERRPPHPPCKATATSPREARGEVVGLVSSRHYSAARSSPRPVLHGERSPWLCTAGEGSSLRALGGSSHALVALARVLSPDRRSHLRGRPAEETQRPVHRGGRPEPLGRAPRPQPAGEDAEHRPAREDGRHLHARVLRRPGVQPVARGTDVRAAARFHRRVRQRPGRGSRSSRRNRRSPRSSSTPATTCTAAGRSTTRTPTAPASGPTTWSAARRRPRRTRTRRTTASAASSSSRSPTTRNCSDENIVDYGIEAAEREARQAVLPRGRVAQAAHAVERAEEVLRPVPARQDRASAARRKTT